MRVEFSIEIPGDDEQEVAEEAWTIAEKHLSGYDVVVERVLS